MASNPNLVPDTDEVGMSAEQLRTIQPGGTRVPGPTVSTQSPYLEGTLPPAIQLQPDLTAQVYTGAVPQTRCMPVLPSGQPAINAAAQSVVKGSASAAASSSAYTPPNSIKSVQTPAVPLASLASSQTTISMARSFTVLGVACTGPMRLRLYSTAAAQSADASRPNSVPPTPGLANGIICDLYLVSPSQYQNWTMSPAAPGFNGDSTQSTNVYCTITNLSGTAASPQATITYAADSQPT